MKYFLIIIIMLCLITHLFAQSRKQICNFKEFPADILKHFDKMGVDDSLKLNIYESAYFNEMFKNSRKSFDFTDKQIAFITKLHNNNKTIYFRQEKQRYYNSFINDKDTNMTTTINQLYVFDSTQKSESGGYDAVILSWSKNRVDKDYLVKRLNKMTNTNKLAK